VPSFDIVSVVDLMEVRNAVDQAARELATRFDFKGTDTSVRLSDEEIHLESSTEQRLEAAVDVLKEKLVRRKVSLKALKGGDPKPAARGRFQTVFGLNQGISQDAGRDLSKRIRDTKLKVQAQVQGDQLRVTGKKRDDLQEVMALLREGNFGLPLQFKNFRD
jgi:uncharacterized protein YajQ (UPF0234 family)